MANRIKVATQPCPDGRHEFNEYAGGGHCSTAYCGWWSEEHCIKCGWFISHCSCGDNDGESKISYRREMVNEKRRWSRNERREGND